MAQIQWNQNMAENHLQKRKHDQMIKLKDRDPVTFRRSNVYGSRVPGSRYQGMYDRQLKIYEEQQDKGRLYPKGNPIFPRKTGRYEEWLKAWNHIPYIKLTQVKKMKFCRLLKIFIDKLNLYKLYNILYPIFKIFLFENWLLKKFLNFKG